MIIKCLINYMYTDTLSAVVQDTDSQSFGESVFQILVLMELIDWKIHVISKNDIYRSHR